MYIQCVECRKKFKVKAGAIPPQGAEVPCKGCGGTLRVEPRNNLEGDLTKIPVTKRKHQKEVKWYARMGEMLRGFGYESKTREYNLLFQLMREYRKRFGITFFDITCQARVARVDRELCYNVLEFSGECCSLPVDGVDSCVASMMEGTAEVLRAKDSGGYFACEPVMRVAYEDSFPTVLKFCLGAAFETSYGETAYGNAARIDVSMDALRRLPPVLAAEDIPQYARVEMGLFPLDSGRLTFAQRTAPGLIVHRDPDPEMRCASPLAARLVERYAS
ncbi:zinc-ribbon domain-containing protein [Desulfocurvus sp. DL9XJH121]